MYDRQEARKLGLTHHCTAQLEVPVTVSGNYTCTDGHFHHVQWHGNTFTVSETGYAKAFLAALDDADCEAIKHHDPESTGYLRAFNAFLAKRGYGAVCLSDPSTSTE